MISVFERTEKPEAFTVISPNAETVAKYEHVPLLNVSVPVSVDPTTISPLCTLYKACSTHPVAYERACDNCIKENPVFAAETPPVIAERAIAKAIAPTIIMSTSVTYPPECLTFDL